MCGPNRGLKSNPMTDKETFTALLTSAGIQFGTPDFADPECPDDVLEVTNSPGRGYSGFLSNWHFDKSGKLIAVGHYE